MANWMVRIAEDPADYARVAALFAEVEGAAEQANCERRLTFTRYRPEFTRFIEIDGRVAAAALLRHDRWLLDGAGLDSGFLEDILTHPEYRRRGLFTALLRDCLRFLQSEGFPLASLHGPGNLCAPFGYVPVRYHAETTLPAGAAAGLPLAGKARPFSPGDLAGVAGLYAATYSRLAASEERNAGVWQWLLATMDDVMVVEGSPGQVSAYAWIQQRLVRTKLRVTEAATADGRAALSLLAALGGRAQRDGLPTVYLALPPDHPLSRAALANGAEARLGGPIAMDCNSGSEARSCGHADQAQVLDLYAALAALTPALERRLACSGYASWQGSIAIDSDCGSASLEIGPGGIQAAARRPAPAATLRLPAALLAPLFLGTHSARELLARPGVQVDGPLLDLYDTLFPARWPSSENDDWWIET